MRWLIFMPGHSRKRTHLVAVSELYTHTYTHAHAQSLVVFGIFMCARWKLDIVH